MKPKLILIVFVLSLIRIGGFEALLFLNAINNSYAEDLKVTNKIKGTNQPVKYGKVYLMENSVPKDSLLLDVNGYGVFRNVATPVEEMPGEYEFRVSNPYPDPAKGSTSVDIEVPGSKNNKNNSVKCSVYDIKGEKIKDFDEQYGPGLYRVEWDGTNNSNEKVASGVYFLRTDAAGRSASVKFAYMKGDPSFSSDMSKTSADAGNQNSQGNQNIHNDQESGRWAATVFKSSGNPAVYQMKFDNADASSPNQTSPKIKPWTTDPFVFSADKDTTVYSERIPVSVSGVVLDAYTLFPVANAKVKATYVDANKTDSTMTDVSGRYMIEFGPAVSDTNEFVVDASKPGFYSYKIRPNRRDYLWDPFRKETRNWPNAPVSDLIDTLYVFEQYIDPMNASSTDARKDLLEYIKDMHRTIDIIDHTYTRISHWRLHDLPLKTFIDTTEGIEYILDEPRFNPGKNGVKITRDAIEKINSHFEKNKFVEVSDISDSNIRIFYGKYGSKMHLHYERNPNFGALYPVSGWVDLLTRSTGDVGFDEAIAMHEFGHIWWTSGVHSPFVSHLISDYLGYHDFSPFEVRAITVLYNLPNTVTSSDPLVVKKYLLHGE